jgi:hypothetical protein
MMGTASVLKFLLPGNFGVAGAFPGAGDRAQAWRRSAMRGAIWWRHEFYGFAETIAFARLSAQLGGVDQGAPTR